MADRKKIYILDPLATAKIQTQGFTVSLTCFFPFMVHTHTTPLTACILVITIVKMFIKAGVHTQMENGHKYRRQWLSSNDLLQSQTNDLQMTRKKFCVVGLQLQCVWIPLRWILYEWLLFTLTFLTSVSTFCWLCILGNVGFVLSFLFAACLMWCSSTATPLSSSWSCHTQWHLAPSFLSKANSPQGAIKGRAA